MNQARQAREDRVRRYFARMTAGDIAGVVALFGAGGRVMSPFLGDMPAAEFFARLGAVSAASTLTVHRLLAEPEGAVAAHFTYRWRLKAGAEVTFEGVDLFEFDPDGRFGALRIFYDTHPLRPAVGDRFSR